jgi:hypothetical protein
LGGSFGNSNPSRRWMHLSFDEKHVISCMRPKLKSSRHKHGLQYYTTKKHNNNKNNSNTHQCTSSIFSERRFSYHCNGSTTQSSIHHRLQLQQMYDFITSCYSCG